MLNTQRRANKAGASTPSNATHATVVEGAVIIKQRKTPMLIAANRKQIEPPKKSKERKMIPW